MRRPHKNHHLTKSLYFNPEEMILDVNMEKLTLEAHKALGNDRECTRIRHRIADAEILALILSGDLPL